MYVRALSCVKKVKSTKCTGLGFHKKKMKNKKYMDAL